MQETYRKPPTKPFTPNLTQTDTMMISVAANTIIHRRWASKTPRKRDKTLQMRHKEPKSAGLNQPKVMTIPLHMY